MKLLVVSMLYEPDCAGGAAVITDLCGGLVQRGHDVTVYTTHPYYPEWKRKGDANPWRIQKEIIDRVHVYRYGLYVPSQPSKLIPRMIHELSFPVSLLRSLFDTRRFDAVMVYCPLLGSVLYAALRKIIRREPLWLNVQDIPADAAQGTGISRSRLFHRAGSFAQRILFNFADRWSSIAPSMVDRLEQLKSNGTPIHLCPNWLHGSLAGEIDKLPSKVGRPPNSPIRLQYAGNIGKKQGLLEFCQFLSGVDAEFEFRINGNGGEADSVRRWVASCGDRRFQFGEFLNEQGFAQALHDSDLFIITERPGVGSCFIPSKLIPCIASGTPLLCICDRDGPLGREVRQYELGTVIPWSTIKEQFAPWLGRAAGEPGLLRRFQQNCLDHALIYRRENAISRFENLLCEFSTGSKRQRGRSGKNGSGVV